MYYNLCLVISTNDLPNTLRKCIQQNVRCTMVISGCEKKKNVSYLKVNTNLFYNRPLLFNNRPLLTTS